jgi:hypothetical protein
MPIFTDNDVADSVGRAFEAAGHSLIRLRDLMATNSPDPIVDQACRAGGLVLVTHNYKDFRRIARERAGLTKRDTNEMCRIELDCEQARAARRVREEMDFIVLAWARFLADPMTAMVVTVGEASIKFARGAEMTGARRVFAKPENLSA